jgi:hypothetical protein
VSKQEMVGKRIMDNAIPWVIAISLVFWIVSGVLMYKQRETAVIWSTYLALIFTLLVPFLSWQKSVQAKRAFFVASQTTILRHTRDINGAGLWMVSGGVASPISVAMRIRYTSFAPAAVMIDSFSAETKDSNGKWVKLNRIDGRDGQVFFATNLAQASPVDMGEGAFDRLLKDRNIQSNETVRGWILFEIPEGVILPEGDVGGDWKFTTKDIFGNRHTESIIQLHEADRAGDRPIQEAGAQLRFQLPSQDISRLPRRFYSDIH